MNIARKTFHSVNHNFGLLELHLDGKLGGGGGGEMAEKSACKIMLTV